MYKTGMFTGSLVKESVQVRIYSLDLKMAPVGCGFHPRLVFLNYDDLYASIELVNACFYVYP